jgi:hypothetical protein
VGLFPPFLRRFDIAMTIINTRPGQIYKPFL